MATGSEMLIFLSSSFPLLNRCLLRPRVLDIASLLVIILETTIAPIPISLLQFHPGRLDCGLLMFLYALPNEKLQEGGYFVVG